MESVKPLDVVMDWPSRIGLFRHAYSFNGGTQRRFRVLLGSSTRKRKSAKRGERSSIYTDLDVFAAQAIQARGARLYQIISQNAGVRRESATEFEVFFVFVCFLHFSVPDSD